MSTLSRARATRSTPLTGPGVADAPEEGVAVAADAADQRRLGLVLAIAGGVGWLAAFVLLIEKYLLLVNPFYHPACSINARISCTSVMTSPQAEVFGFPNPLLGIAGLAIVLTTAMVILAGGRLADWYWAGLQLGSLFGIGFVHWLIWQSLFSIKALCPYCMVVWAAMIVIFVYVTSESVRRMNLDPTSVLATLALNYRSSVAVVWLLVVTAAVVITSIAAF